MGPVCFHARRSALTWRMRSGDCMGGRGCDSPHVLRLVPEVPPPPRSRLRLVQPHRNTNSYSTSGGFIHWSIVSSCSSGYAKRTSRPSRISTSPRRRLAALDWDGVLRPSGMSAG